MLIGYFKPYKGYRGTIEYSVSDNCYFGRIICDSLINYEADDVMKLYKNFKYVVDDYIEFQEVIKNE